jgi:hypothetical protein
MASVALANCLNQGVHPTSAPAGNCHTYFVAELILLACFAFGDALHFRLMHTVELVLVVPLLRVDLMRGNQ